MRGYLLLESLNDSVCVREDRSILLAKITLVRVVDLRFRSGGAGTVLAYSGVERYLTSTIRYALDFFAFSL